MVLQCWSGGNGVLLRGVFSRSKLIRMSIRLLTGGQLVRFQSGAPGVFHEDVGKRSSRQTFNLENAGSNPAVLTMCPVGPMDHDASLRNSRFRFESGAGCQVFGRVFQRPGWGTVYASTGVRLPSRPPSWPSQFDIRQPLTRMLDGGRFGAGKLIR
jgi:hypothetical protein